MSEPKPRATPRAKKACHRCGSLDVVPIVYGLPLPEAMDEADKGLIELGGCCVAPDDPQKKCKACGEEFDRPRRPLSARPGA
jgi:hypothetical protein